ncbi:MAG TPA: class I SAM-dependent methyltransferase [Candidatus Saccharimonadales bacterium]|nr:class I SAM-dependent methyltransferase [Candidatus Saccharimonadales bacterium]
MKNVVDKSLADTGERMIPAYHKGHMVYGEHIVRYQAALPLVKGKTVLDVASGSGYGSSFLSTTAKKVYGVDVDKDAIAYAKKNYASKNTEFVLGDGTSIPLEDNSVEVVVSFETIEHIEDYETFMKEVKRVLKDDGLFILSTPNDVEFPETNHFHIHEFERTELQKLVARYFKHTKSYYQATWLYNALIDEAGITKEWESPVQTIQTAPVNLDKCIYFYMLCTNRKLTESVEPLAAISEHWSARQIQEYEAGVRMHIEDQGAVMKHHENTISQKEAELEMTRKELNRLQTELNHIQKSVVGRLYQKAARLRKK